ncbi:MAG: murein transglycosylase [Rickettsiales bacterium]|nr:murein transglycosylase [Rickettsiales bacterium]
MIGLNMIMQGPTMANILRMTAIIGSILLISACSERLTDTPSKTRQAHWLISKQFLDLPGWTQDHQGEALSAFLKSCPVLVSRAAPILHFELKEAVDWRTTCAKAAQIDARDKLGSRLFFETWFQPYLVVVNDAKDGLFTGYFEAELRGSRTPDETFKYPLHGVPNDLISVDLGRFDDNLRGRRVVGRVESGHMVPYPSRADIQKGLLANKAKVLAWVDDPIDAFLLHVQGSGRVMLRDGGILRIGYAGNNGHSYVSIGRALVKKGELLAGRAGWVQIRRWLEENSGKTDFLLAANPRYIFFREIANEGPIGAQGVALTPRRSIAVDARYIPLGAPLWLDTAWPGDSDRPLQRLMVAQDTGSAIKGPIRGDFFWGFGKEALKEAGRMKSRGNYFILIPKSTQVAGS